MSIHVRCSSIALLVLFATANTRADMPIYIDSMESGFENWSYGGGSNFANTAPVHGGAFSIALTGNQYNAVSFVHPFTALDSTSWPTLKLWVHGGSSGGQSLQLILQNEGVAVAQAPISAYLNGGPVAATWRQATIAFAQAPLSYSGPFDRIDIQSNAAAAQPMVYFDDIALAAPANAVDPIFADGFDTPTAATTLTIDRDVAVGGMTSDRFRWIDSVGRPRSAALAHNNGAAGPNGTRGGELREFRYEVAGATRVVTATDDPFGGFGYVVAHPADEGRCTGGGDPSSLGHFTPGTFERVFEGRHHAIFRFKQAYPRYCTTAAPAAQYNTPVTIDWVFSSGRDDPLWSITWDLSAVPVNRLNDDSRAPYGQMRIDGAANDSARAQIAGVAWGDYYRFTSTNSPVTFNSAWTWNQPNTIPFVKLWTAGFDATMGLVQTRTIAQQDAGGYWGQDLWNRTSAQTSGCPANHLMPCNYNWPFQSINYELFGGATRNARLAWGTNFGFLGQQQYRVRGNSEYGGAGNGTALPGDPKVSGWPKKSYSTYVVFGTHSSDPVGARVAAIETIQSLALSATIGSVVTQGAAGVADATPTAFQPAGYNPVYGALAFNASSNRLDANIAVGAGTLKQPMLIVSGYAAGNPSALRLNGVALIADRDYFASRRADSGELWITLNRNLAGAANRIEIVP